MHHICACVYMYQRVNVCMLMFDSLQPHGLQPTKTLCLWDSPGKNTRVGSVQFSSVTQLFLLFVTPWTAVRQDSMSITNSQSLLKLMSTEMVMPSNHLTLSGPLLLLPSTFPNISVFSNESFPCIRCPKYWSFCLASILTKNVQE